MSAAQRPSDFVQVQLTAAGAAAAPVHVANGHFSYSFTPGASVRVLTSEWTRILSKQKLNGETLLELASADVPTAAPTPAPAAPAPAAPAPAAAAPKPPNQRRQQDEQKLAELVTEETQLNAVIAQEEN